MSKESDTDLINNKFLRKTAIFRDHDEIYILIAEFGTELNLPIISSLNLSLFLLFKLVNGRLKMSARAEIKLFYSLLPSANFCVFKNRFVHKGQVFMIGT